MIASSRPIRFLTLVLGGWVGARTVMLWPVAAIVPEVVRSLAPAAVAEAATAPPITGPMISASQELASTWIMPRPGAIPLVRTGIEPAVTPLKRKAADPALVALALAGLIRFGPAIPLATAGSDPPIAFRASRWSGSAWAILRPGGRATPFASQLGGSQAGARIAYAVDGARRLAIVARVSTALSSRQKEAAIGLDWRPTSLPIHLVAEQRIGVENARGGPAIGVIGGIGPTPVAANFRLEAYGQAGVIARDGAEGFADGAVRVTRPVAETGGVSIDVGAGVWGAAQRGASRLDVGPSIGVRIPVARTALRVSLDWRQRIAGGSRPGPGPALSIGTDF